LKSGVSVATFNTGLIRAQIAGHTIFEFAPHVEIRSKYIAGTLQRFDPDIICFQEIFSKKHLKQILDSLGKTHPYTYAPFSFRPKIFGSGLALFSKYPILQSNFYWFKCQLFEEALFAPKAFMVVTVDVGSFGLIEIVNCHTTAGGSKHHPESHAADNCRQLQLGEIIELLMQRDASIAHSLLVGDLNCGPEASKSNYEFLISRGFADLTVIAHPVSRPAITWDPENSLNVESPHKTSPPQRIDHILGHSRAKLIVDGYRSIGKEPTVEVSPKIRCTPSDHYGVMLTLRNET
jgi:endonuclease/exonuclease/phosphatase family metal-dependent hydrolase